MFPQHVHLRGQYSQPVHTEAVYAALEMGYRCLELDVYVDALAAEIARNSPGTNRRVKRLLHDRGETTHREALLRERTLPYGLPEDMQERMSAR